MIFPERIAPVTIPALVTGVLLLALAGWLLYLDHHSRVHRALALLVGDLAVYRGAYAFFGADGFDWEIFRAYFELAIPFLAAYFVIEYRRRHWRLSGPSAPHRYWAVLGTLAVLLIMLEALFVFKPALDWFLLVEPINMAFFAYIALMFIRDYVASQNPSHRPALLLAALAFAVMSGFLTASHFLQFAFSLRAGEIRGDEPLLWATLPLQLITFILVGRASAFLLLDAYRQREPARRVWTRRAAILLLLSILSAIYVRAAQYHPVPTYPFSPSDVLQFLNAFWTAMVAGLLSYALIKYKLFDIDIRIKSTLRRSLVLSTFLVAFFIAEEFGQNLVQSNTNSFLLGIAGAAVVALAFVPVKKFAARLASAGMPHVDDTPIYLDHRKHDVYQAAFEGVLIDGIITPKEHRMLEILKHKLDLTAEQASAIEEETRRRMPSLAAGMGAASESTPDVRAAR